MKEQADPSVKALPPGTKQVVLGESALRADGKRPGVGERTHLSQTVHQAFLPLGLYVQGATSETTIRRINCGNWRVDGDSSIPALYFSTHKTLAELHWPSSERSPRCPGSGSRWWSSMSAITGRSSSRGRSTERVSGACAGATASPVSSSKSGRCRA